MKPAPRTSVTPRSANAAAFASACFAIIGAIRIDEQFGIRSDRVACGAHTLDIRRRIAADFHLDLGQACVDPAVQLPFQLHIGIGRKTAAAISRD